jgi:hypothetical protein
MTDKLKVFICGPSSDKCKCTCSQDDNSNNCEHKWDGPWTPEPDDNGTRSVTCSRCGMSAINHDIWLW